MKGSTPLWINSRLAAAEIDGVNTVLMEEHQASTSPASLGGLTAIGNHGQWQGLGRSQRHSGAQVDFETNFNLDLNGDGTIGQCLKTVNTAGSVAFTIRKHQDHWSGMQGLWSISVAAAGSRSPTGRQANNNEGIYGWLGNWRC